MIGRKWTLARHTRIFQDKSAIEILDEVLGQGLSPYGRQHQMAVDATYPTREYCVQYQESDWAFCQRLIEEERITISFDQEGDTEKLVLRDRNASHPQTPTMNGAIAIPFQPHALDMTTEEPIIEVRRREKETTTSVVIADWDWTRADMPLASKRRPE